MSTRRYLSNIDNQQTLKRQKTEHKQLEIQCNSVEFNRPFYNYGWKRGWSGPCFDTTISAFLVCKSFFFFNSNQYFLGIISIRKQRRFVSKLGYALRCNRRFIVPKCKTDRFRNSFIIRSCTLIFRLFITFFTLFYLL